MHKGRAPTERDTAFVYEKGERRFLTLKLRQGLFHAPNRQNTEEFPLLFTPGLFLGKEQTWREKKWKLFGVLPIWRVKEALPKFMR